MPARLRFDAIGTRWSIDTQEPLGDEVVAAIRDRIDAYDRAWSRFRPDATIAPLAQAAGEVRMPAESAELATLYRRLHDVTDGAVTPLVGASLERLGYRADGVADTGLAPEAPPAWDAVLQWEGTTLRTTAPLVLDVGAAGKGQLVDLVGDVLDAHGIHDRVVDASGDLRHAGAGDQGRATRVALEDPRAVGHAIGVVEVEGEAFCASAGNRRRWAGRHHILDGRTGAPTDEVIGTWVIAERAMVADAIATALSFAPVGLLARHWSFEHARMYAGGQVEATGRFAAGLHVRKAAA
ncbi:FAD:protein FMN transferase [Agrococcus jejuensis]|uniref:FAD:protein FMN transferase n=1 Tax=Agrococcus jejuensis TaxID=399736 RepID=A0A1G8BBZ8_9MICO|nr:FAD:protein FMN transferase [Agrococcus jejuensis]SDH30563.1 thiamine biosynthesis lipoprotein [Agrococcus jejuensis]